MQRLIRNCKLFVILTVFLVISQTGYQVNAAENYDELFVLIGDSLMKSKDGNQEVVSKNIEQFAKEWASLKKEDSKQGKLVDQKLKEVQRILTENPIVKTELSKGLSALSKAVVQYDKEQNPKDKSIGKEKVKQLLPLINNLKVSLEKGNTTSLTLQYQTLLNQWNTAEKVVHDESVGSYGNIEKYMALTRIAITQEPTDFEKAESNLDQLTMEMENFLSGKVSKSVKGNYTLSDLSTLLSNAYKQITNENYENASTDLNEILTIWPIVEGDVQTRDSKLYSDMETKIPTAISMLNSQKVNAHDAQEIIKNIQSRLAPLLSKTDYSIWDAALILLREGLEALLIVATLLAFLKKVGQSEQKKWIWSGVAAGILASAILAIIINIVFSKIVAASSREYIEGITGIVAVIMMLTVGAWLHSKSNVGNWNKYIHDQMHQAIAKGSLLSFAFISFLSVFREGAETIIFYTGITPYIGIQQLVIGILAAIVLLAIVGFALIYYSVKIPIRLFFMVATILIYILAFKILGISIHALQIANVLPTTTVPSFPFIDWIGLYPTWETTITQFLLLIVIVCMTFLVRKKVDKRTITANS